MQEAESSHAGGNGTSATLNESIAPRTRPLPSRKSNTAAPSSCASKVSSSGRAKLFHICPSLLKVTPIFQTCAPN